MKKGDIVIRLEPDGLGTEGFTTGREYVLTLDADEYGYSMRDDDGDYRKRPLSEFRLKRFVTEDGAFEYEEAMQAREIMEGIT